MPKRAASSDGDAPKRGKADAWQTLQYMSGFGNEFATELLPGVLPKGQNSPQIAAYGLYAEQLSGTAFTVPRAGNQRSWLYRIRPAVLHSPLKPYSQPRLCSNPATLKADPNQMRWQPQTVPTAPTDFVDGLTTMAGSDGALMVHLYACNENMTNKPSGESRSLYNSDGDMLIVPQQGALRVTTEFGRMLVSPHEICVVQRGIRFSVDVEGPSRGYICEILKGHFEIPSLGPIGANGLANPRDFVTPVAWYEGYTPEHTEAAEAAGAVATSVATTAPAVASAASSGAADPAAAAASSSSSASASTSTSTGAAAAGGGLSGASGRWVILNKYGHGLFAAEQAHSPYDVVGWHGNYAPYKYNLDDFVCMNSVTVDHPDPSIYTVLTCQSDTPGVAITDFVIFPPRWMVMERSFRPPYYHRNCMTEYMGMVYGKYDAKVGFVPGGSSLHSIGTPHGPDAPTFKGASTAELAPEKFDGGLAFMFETCEVLKLTEYALRGPDREWAYQACWSGLPALFKPGRPVVTPAELAAGVSASIASAAGTGEAAAAAAHAAADAVASGAPSASAAAASSSSH